MRIFLGIQRSSCIKFFIRFISDLWSVPFSSYLRGIPLIINVGKMRFPQYCYPFFFKLRVCWRPTTRQPQYSLMLRNATTSIPPFPPPSKISNMFWSLWVCSTASSWSSSMLGSLGRQVLSLKLSTMDYASVSSVDTRPCT